MKADLHLHSTASDGTLEPGELVALAAEMGFTHLALTDHDSVAGLERAGDAAGVEAFDEYTTHLSNGIVTVIDFLDPEMILLGGGVSAAGDFLLDPVRAKVERNKFYTSRPHASIELAALGNDAGIIGAAMLGRQ